MKVSIVTISYNQGQFLEQALLSVIEQSYPELEYIVVDPGSTDESRKIIKKYTHQIDKIIFEPDQGPADGLNSGFNCATGDIFGFVNADDFLLPDAVRIVVDEFRRRPDVDVLSGHAKVVNERGCVIRNTYSDLFSLKRYAYGVCILIQPSTFFRSGIYRIAGGFNHTNHSSWDADLFIEMGLRRARFSRVNSFLSGFRVHATSITGSRRLEALNRYESVSRFKKIMNREMKWYDLPVYYFLKSIRYLTNPLDVFERIVKGPIYGRVVK